MATSTTTHTGKGKTNGAAAAAMISSGNARPRPGDDDLIGVSIVAANPSFALRIAVRPHHLKAIGSPEKVDIRGTLRDGILIAPGKGYKARPISKHLIYIQLTADLFDSRIKEGERAQIWLRPEIKSGHIQLPGMPEAWIALEKEFERHGGRNDRVLDTGPRTARLSPFPGDTDTTEEQRAVVPVPPPAPPAVSATVPLARAPVPNYQVPSDIRDMQAALSTHIEYIRAIMREMEAKTGMSFTLSRNLQVVVNLQGKENK